jgi:arginase family enzyme
MHDNNVEVLPDVDFAKITQWLAKKPKYEFLGITATKPAL